LDQIIIYLHLTEIATFGPNTDRFFLLLRPILWNITFKSLNQYLPVMEVRQFIMQPAMPASRGTNRSQQNFALFILVCVAATIAAFSNGGGGGSSGQPDWLIVFVVL
jgi:hypothetical protein